MLTSDFIKNALLQYNYFPLQKELNEEIPSIFTSETLTLDVAKNISSAVPNLRKGGYDECIFNATRFNNVARKLSIPHPLPYIKLVNHIADNWENIKHIENNKESAVRPMQHDDGRIIKMKYGPASSKNKKLTKLSRGKKFLVKTDIANFYPSIYTHSIAWALLGIDEAKKKQKGGYANDLDTFQRMAKRNETIGVAIGPGTSNIVTEIILHPIDQKLRDSKYEFIRYIDDYTAFFDTYENAEEFIRVLGTELSKYGLLLNIKKTEIKKLPQPSSDNWISDIGSRLSQRIKINDYYCSRMLDYAIELQNKNNGGSILKYTIKSLAAKSNSSSKIYLLENTISLSLHYPILLPVLLQLFDTSYHYNNDKYHNQLIAILDDNIKNNRSDGMVWCLFYIMKYYNYEIPDDFVDRIIQTGDCLSITLLSLFHKYEGKIISFADEITQRTIFDVDQHWILLYQLYYNNKIANPYSNKSLYNDLASNGNNQVNEGTVNNLSGHDQKSFEILKQNKVSFVDMNSLNNKKTTISSFKKLFTKMIHKIANKVESAST